VATIKTQLEASGVSQFRQQMQQASGAVKAMGAELKVAEAAYKQTGDQAAYLAEKSDILKQQLEEQKKAVSAAEKALDTVKKQYGEGSTQVNEWRKKLADARATMIQTETAIKNTDAAMDALGKDDVSGVAKDLGKVGDEAKKADTAADGLAESVGGIAGKLDRDAIIKGLDSIADAMTSLMTRAFNLGKALWSLSLDGAAWGDETRDMAQATDLSITRYQQAGYAAQFFGSSIESLTAAQPKLVKAIKAADNGVLQIGDNLVNTMEWVSDGRGGYIQQERSWLDVFLDSMDALGDVESEFEREAIAQELFGKSYRDYMGILAGGTDEFRKKMNAAPVVSEDNVNSLADANDAIKDMDAQLETLKMDVLAALAPDIELIAHAIGGLAKNLDDFVKSEKGQELLGNLSKSIEGIITSLTTTDFSGIVERATGVIDGINEALQWLADNKVDVVDAIIAIATAIGTLKVASFGLSLVNGINGLKGLIHGGKPTTTPTTAPATTPTTTPTTAPAIAPAAGAPGLTWGALAADALKFAGMDSLVIAAATAPAMWAHDWNVNETEARINAVMAKTEQDAAVLGEEATQFSEVIGIAAGALGIDRNDRNFLGQVKLSDPAKVSAALKGLQPYAEFLSTIMDAKHMEELNKYWNDTSELDPFEVTQLLEDVMSTTSEKLSTAAAGLDASAPAVAGAASGLVDSAIAVLNGATAALNRNAGSTAGYGAFSANANLYIQNYNQNGGSDASALASAVATAQSQLRRGYGARR